MIGADAAFPKYRSELNRPGGNPRSNRTFPPEYAIPGYTGFIDSMNSILITSKPNLREPLDFAPPAENLQRQAVKTQEAALRKPTYTADYTAKPESYSGGSGPFALGKPAQTTALPVAQPVAAARGGEASTLGDSLATTDAGDVGGPAFGSSGPTAGTRPATSHGGAAGGTQQGTSLWKTASGPPLGFRGYSGVESTYRGHFLPKRAQTAPANATRPPKQDIMFQTTYGNHFGVDSDVARNYRDEMDPLGYRPLTAAPAYAAAAATTTGTTGGGQSAIAHQQNQPKVKQYLEDKTTYAEDFSLRPLDKNAPIRAGTVKQTNQVPSYCGFIPSSKTNPLALRHSYEPSAARVEQAEGVRLLTLDQYSRLRPATYMGYRPQAPPNAHVFDPPNANLNTTTGRSEFYGTIFKGKPAKSVGPNADMPKQSMLSFFTPGKTAVSDNGITNAQRFYVGCRPNEGLPALYRAPGTTYYGKRFQPQGVTTFQ